MGHNMNVLYVTGTEMTNFVRENSPPFINWRSSFILKRNTYLHASSFQRVRVQIDIIVLSWSHRRNELVWRDTTFLPRFGLVTCCKWVAYLILREWVRPSYITHAYWVVVFVCNGTGEGSCQAECGSRSRVSRREATNCCISWRFTFRTCKPFCRRSCSEKVKQQPDCFFSVLYQGLWKKTW